jgi:polyphosphate kinase
MGSADWMGRNLDRRVETVVPVLDPVLRDRITFGILDVLREDNTKTRWLQSDGSYVRRVPQGGEIPVSAQSLMLEAAKAL